MTKFSEYNEELELYKQSKRMEDKEFLEGSLTAGKNFLSYNTQKEEEKSDTIKNILTTINEEDLEKFEVIKGELLINTQSKTEIDIAQSLGIAVNPYDITEDGTLESSNGNLLLMDEEGTLTVPDSVRVIGQGAFSGLDGLKTIIIPSSVTEIAIDAFSYNATLENVIFQENSKLEIIGIRAFNACRNLKSINLPNGLKKLEQLAFYNCTSLEEITVPGSVKEIGAYCFSACKNLSKINLQEGLEKIIDNAFSYVAIKDITIPSTVTSIGVNVFNQNKLLENIIIAGENYIYESKILMPKNKSKILFIADSYLNSVNTFEIPEGVKEFHISISTYTNINTIVIPKSLEVIGDTLPAFPNNVTDIQVVAGNQRFEVRNKMLYDKINKEIVYCFSKDEVIDLTKEPDILSLRKWSFYLATNAKEIDLPNTLEKISAQVFDMCKKIEKIKIGKNVSSIDPIFKHENYLGTIELDSENPYYYIEGEKGKQILYKKKEVNGKVENKYTLASILYDIEGEYTVDSEVKEIATGAFHAKAKLKKVNIPEGVTSIGQSFSQCAELEEVNIPSTVTSIGDYCFERCQKLSRININKKEGTIEFEPWEAPKGEKAVYWLK